MGEWLLIHWKLPGNAAGDPRADPPTSLSVCCTLTQAPSRSAPSLYHPPFFFGWFFSRAEVAHPDSQLCKRIRAAQPTLGLQPCFTLLFLSQVLHRNFQKCVLLKPKVKTYQAGGAGQATHSAADWSTCENHQPHLTQEAAERKEPKLTWHLITEK